MQTKKADADQNLLQYCKKQKVDFRLEKTLANLLHYIDLGGANLFNKGHVQSCQDMTCRLFGVNATLISHPASSQYSDDLELKNGVGINYSNTMFNMIRHHKLTLDILHNILTTFSYFEDVENGSESERLIRAEAHSRLHVMHALNLCANHRNCLTKGNTARAMYSSALHNLRLYSAGWDDVVQQRLMPTTNTALGLMEYNAILVDIIALAAVQSE